MVRVSADVREIDGKHFIIVGSGASEIKIPMSDDRPNEVKAAFNKLIEAIRKEELRIEFVGKSDDLFSHVAKEYVEQLNREIAEVRRAMEERRLVLDEPEPE
jgi:intergrase/recombinase